MTVSKKGFQQKEDRAALCHGQRRVVCEGWRRVIAVTVIRQTLCYCPFVLVVYLWSGMEPAGFNRRIWILALKWYNGTTLLKMLMEYLCLPCSLCNVFFLHFLLPLTHTYSPALGCLPTLSRVFNLIFWTQLMIFCNKKRHPHKSLNMSRTVLKCIKGSWIFLRRKKQLLRN